MKCTDCKYCLQEDYGYSNYTVEGTTVSCLLEQHQDKSFDRFYGEEPKLAFANECGRFIAGEGPYIDCDHDLGDMENYSDDPEIKALLRNA